MATARPTVSLSELLAFLPVPSTVARVARLAINPPCQRNAPLLSKWTLQEFPSGWELIKVELWVRGQYWERGGQIQQTAVKEGGGGGGG